MRVCIHEAGQQGGLAEIANGHIGVQRGNPLPYFSNPAILDPDLAVFDHIGFGHRQNVAGSVDNAHLTRHSLKRSKLAAGDCLPLSVRSRSTNHRSPL